MEQPLPNPAGVSGLDQPMNQPQPVTGSLSAPEISRPTVSFRPATPDDTESIRLIMAYFVRHSTATWRYQTPGPAWVAAFDQAHFDDGCPNPRRPVWVATVAEPSAQVIGYCCLSDFRSGEGYWPCSENSVYVLPDWAHAGIGRRLMEIVLAAGRDAGVYVVIAGVAGDNVASIRFHEQFGFKICGHLPKIGYKFDRWLDLTLLQLNLIDGRPAVPEPWPSQFERL